MSSLTLEKELRRMACRVMTPNPCSDLLEPRRAGERKANAIVRSLEYLFGSLKSHELGNFCPLNLSERSSFARRRLRSMQHRPTLVAAFWKQAALPLGVFTIYAGLNNR